MKLCKECKYAEKIKDNDQEVDCLRYPPTPVPIPQQNSLGQMMLSINFVYPRMKNEGYCGEFRTRV